MGSGGGNRLWSDLCRDLAYAPAYAVSHLLDPGVFHFFGGAGARDGESGLGVWLVYDSSPGSEKLIVLENGAGYTDDDLETLADFEETQARG